MVVCVVRACVCVCVCGKKTVQDMCKYSVVALFVGVCA